MNISNFLSKVIGKYLIIVSAAMLINTHQFMLCLNGLTNNAQLMFVVGIFTLILGILMVMSHNIWQWNWRILVTIISWITLIKGASIIIYPHALNKITQLFIENMNVYYIGAGLDLILGILLCYFGFKRE